MLITRFYDPFWADLEMFFRPSVPDGYELIEKEEHKKQRLQEGLEEKRRSLAYLEKRLTELTSAIESDENSLKSLGP